LVNTDETEAAAAYHLWMENSAMNFTEFTKALKEAEPVLDDEQSIICFPHFPAVQKPEPEPEDEQ